MKKLPLAACVVASALATGCIKSMILNGQIEGTREGAKAMDSTADYEVARAAAAAGIAQFEGMHRLAPDNTDGYYLLVKGYASYAAGFVEDEMALADLRGDDDEADYQKERAASLYTRGIGFGTQWMEAKHPGFENALKTGKAETMQAYIKQFTDAEDADILFWTGQAWMARTNVWKKPEWIGTIYVGVQMIEQVVALSPSYEDGIPHVLLGSYYAGTGEATLGPDSFAKSKEHFDRAKQISNGKILLVQLQEAATYVCHKNDDSKGRSATLDAFRKEMQSVLDDPAEDPDHRLLNAVAKRRARRFLSEKWIKGDGVEECGWDL